MSRYLTRIAKFVASRAREREIEGRYEQIRRSLNISQAGVELAQIQNDGFRTLLSQLDNLGVVIGADSVLPPVLAIAQPRLAVTLVLQKRRPVIWLNLVKHGGRVAVLVDTVAHEAIHSTVVMLKRHRRSPQPDEEIAYHGEEIVALTGANHILAEINFPAKRQIEMNVDAIESHKAILRQLGCTEEFLAERAADGAAAKAFLMDHLLKMKMPTLAEIRARRPRRQ